MRLSDETGVQCTFPPCIPDGKMLFSCQGASLFNAKKHWRGLPSNDYNISHVVLFYRGMQCYHARRELVNDCACKIIEWLAVTTGGGNKAATELKQTSICNVAALS